jgi:hypothetical protein
VADDEGAVVGVEEDEGRDDDDGGGVGTANSTLHWQIESTRDQAHKRMGQKQLDARDTLRAILTASGGKLGVGRTGASELNEKVLSNAL